MPDNVSKEELLDRIEKEALDYEMDFHGCSRCVLKPLQDNLDLGDEIISHLIDGDATIAELSTTLSASSFELLPIFQRLFRYKLISLKNNASSLELQK